MRSLGRLYRGMLISLIFAVTASGLFAYSDSEWDPVILSGRFFVQLEPAGPFEPEVFDEELAINRLLDEASFVFSAMIYGFDFTYTPLDTARSVAEEFEISPVHSIAAGDPALEVKAGRFSDGIYYADISYRLSDSQIPWYDSWESGASIDVISRGEGSLTGGLEGKLDSLRDAVKQALRDHLRPRLYNKPRRVDGRARLNTVPDITMASGRFRSRAGVTLEIDEILEYEIF